MDGEFVSKKLNEAGVVPIGVVAVPAAGLLIVKTESYEDARNGAAAIGGAQARQAGLPYNGWKVDTPAIYIRA